MIFLALALTMYSVRGRTCVCAEFSEESCDAEENCQWNSRESLGLITRVNSGLCRTHRWVECHQDPNCFHVGRFVDATTLSPAQLAALEAEEAAKAAEENGARKLMSFMEDTDPAYADWPYSCDTGDYHEELIDVRPFEYAVQQRQKYESVTDDIMISQPISMVIKLAIMVVFMSLIGFAACYKFKDNNTKYQLLKDTPSTYSAV